MESNLKHSVDVHDNMSILKSKLINMPVDCFYSNLNKKPGTAVEVDEKEILIKPDSLSSKNKKDIIITNTSLLENKNFSLGQVLNLHTKLPPVSIFTSSITEITSLSQYTDR